MNSERTPARRPIAAVRVSTVALLGVAAAVTVPTVAAALVMSGSIDTHQRQQDLGQAGPVTRVVVQDSDSSVRITGDPALAGVTGQATLTWHSFTGSSNAKVAEQYADGVLTLTKDCGGDCGAAIDIRVPPNVSVQVTTSNAGINVANVSGGVNLDTSNDGITASRLGAGDATLHTSNGSINASFVGGPKNISATTSNAGVTIVTDGHTAYYNDVQTRNGNTDLGNPQARGSDNTLYVRTSNADVTTR
jgi:hypothetical protein